MTSLRPTLVGHSHEARDVWLMRAVNVVPRLEDELVSVLHEATYDLGIVQSTFMVVLTYVLSSMKVCGTVPRIWSNNHRPDRLDPGQRRLWAFLERSGAWLVCGI